MIRFLQRDSENPSFCLTFNYEHNHVGGKKINVFPNNLQPSSARKYRENGAGRP